MKTLIIHDRFQFRGGAERLVLILARALNADIVTEFWTDESYDPKEAPGKLFVLSSGEAPWIVWRYFRAQLLFLFKTRSIIQDYDTLIFSGNNCLAASFHFKHGKKKILYCHSPVRHAFDLFEFSRSEQKRLWKRVIYYSLGAHLIRFIYRLSLKKMHTVVANSYNIKDRLEKFVRHPANHVVYPPIDIHKFKWIAQGDYYLSFGRLERLKRIPDIVRAFQAMPHKKLIVVSGGPDLAKVKEMANGHPNIQVTGWVSDDELKNLIGNCIASIYIPLNEDAGMTQLESMSAGKPCLGVFDGGLKETILDEKTGKFIPAGYTTQDLINAVAWLTPKRASSMRQACEQHAQAFSSDRFIQQIKQIISSS